MSSELGTAPGVSNTAPCSLLLSRGRGLRRPAGRLAGDDYRRCKRKDRRRHRPQWSGRAGCGCSTPMSMYTRTSSPDFMLRHRNRLCSSSLIHRIPLADAVRMLGHERVLSTGTSRQLAVQVSPGSLPRRRRGLGRCADLGAM